MINIDDFAATRLSKYIVNIIFGFKVIFWDSQGNQCIYFCIFVYAEHYK